jgi:hypothetical protein
MWETCALFFEGNIAPILHQLEESQKRLDAQLLFCQAELANKTSMVETRRILTASIRKELAITKNTAVSFAAQEPAYEDECDNCADDPSHFKPVQLNPHVASSADIHAPIVQTQHVADELRSEFRELLADTMHREHSSSEFLVATNALNTEVEKMSMELCQVRQDVLALRDRVLTASLLGSDAASDVASLTGSVLESVTSSTLDTVPEQKEARRRPLPLVLASARPRLAARRKERQERLLRQGKAPVASFPGSLAVPGLRWGERPVSGAS